jgi:hypothetical protein
MNFEKFLHWLRTNFQKSQMIRSLGGKTNFKAKIHDDGNQLNIEYGTRGKFGYFSDDNLKLVWGRYMSLGGKKQVASEYTDPNWTQTPNRVLAPYAAALIRDFENDFQAQ